MKGEIRDKEGQNISELKKPGITFVRTKSVTLQTQGINVFTLKDTYLMKWLLHFTLREMCFLFSNYNSCIQMATLVLPNAAKRVFQNKLDIELNSWSNPILEDFVNTGFFPIL